MSRKIVMSRAIAAATLAAICSSATLADIRFEDRGKRFSLDVRDEPIAEVMDSLSERFDFKVDGYPEHWSKDPMNFSATGDLERVLRSLLKDTSHVFEYHTDPETRETRIAALKLLNEGVAGFVANRPAQANSITNSTTEPGITRGTGSRQPGRLADRPTGFNQTTSGATETDGRTPAAGATASAPVSGLSASLAARARQSTATASQTASNSGKAPAAPAEPGVPNADMQALTQKALKDVQGLAEALKKAEGK